MRVGACKMLFVCPVWHVIDRHKQGFADHPAFQEFIKRHPHTASMPHGQDFSGFRRQEERGGRGGAREIGEGEAGRASEALSGGV